jgi:hypothetical protein
MAIYGVAMAIAVTAVIAPYLPLGPDIYQHLVWDWQVMRCLAEWQLPLWLPDLNAGFGNPGIRLYSPLGPVLTGILGTGLGDAGRGLRAAAILAAFAVLWVARRQTTTRSAVVGAAVLISPMVLFSLFGRAAWSEFLSVPLMLWLLLGMVKGELEGGRDGLMLALLWLAHAPTTIMVGFVGVGTLAIHRSREYAVRALQAVVVGCGLTAWHWMPLLRETAEIEAEKVMTGGMYEPARNFLASETAHTPQVNAWLAYAAGQRLAGVDGGRAAGFSAGHASVGISSTPHGARGRLHRFGLTPRTSSVVDSRPPPASSVSVAVAPPGNFAADDGTR